MRYVYHAYATAIALNLERLVRVATSTSFTAEA